MAIGDDTLSNPIDRSPSPSEASFEQIRRIDPDGLEFWSARDLTPILEYAKWQNFKTVLL